MNLPGAVLSLVLLTLVYLGALVWIDARGGLLHLTAELPGILGVLIGIAIASWVVRFCRWHRLMRRAGFSPPWLQALLAYVAGFSFTATPGKVGELIRIRYFDRLGVPAKLVVGLFVYERCLDLLAVLLLAMIAMNQFDQFWIAAAFAIVLVVIVLLVASNAAWLASVARRLDGWRLGGMAKVMHTLADGLAEARRWANWRDLCVSLGMGLAAWGLLALSFCWLLGRLGVDVPLSTAVAIYPLSLLVGAASMLPGGLGSTEATIVGLLVLNRTPIEIAMTAAIAARLSSLWAAIVFGLVSLVLSESVLARKVSGR
jgi:uncharacterized protein (TIRG00374 family)